MVVTFQGTCRFPALTCRQLDVNDMQANQPFKFMQVVPNLA